MSPSRLANPNPRVSRFGQGRRLRGRPSGRWLLSVLALGAFLACGGGDAGPADARTGSAGERAVSEARIGNGEEPPECRLVEQGFGPAGTVEVRVEEVARDREVPGGIAFLPGGGILVTERPGRVRLVDENGLVDRPVATVETAGRAEGGLLGIALHPDFDENRAFFLYVTVADGGGSMNRIERWRLTEDSRSARRESVVFDDIPAAPFHNGGRLRIGPDGMLYAGTGDAGSPDRSRDSATPAGKILRLAPDGSIPEDNPFQGSPAWVIGLRNTQGFDWPDGDTLWITDHGPSGEMGRTGHDEVSVAGKGDDLGWPDVYGCQEAKGLVTPALTWEQAAPPGGAAIYTGDAISEWQGDLIVGTLGSRHLHRVVLSDAGRATRHEVYFPGDEGFGRLREVIMGPDGDLYVTTSNCDGRGRCPAEGDRILRLTR